MTLAEHRANLLRGMDDAEWLAKTQRVTRDINHLISTGCTERARNACDVYWAEWRTHCEAQESATTKPAPQTADTPIGEPFESAEQAWFWTMDIICARKNGAPTEWRPDGPGRPCKPDNVISLINALYNRRSIALIHARILRIWGERQIAPDPNIPDQAEDFRLWREAMALLEPELRARGIVGRSGVSVDGRGAE